MALWISSSEFSREVSSALPPPPQHDCRFEFCFVQVLGFGSSSLAFALCTGTLCSGTLRTGTLALGGLGSVIRVRLVCLVGGFFRVKECFCALAGRVLQEIRHRLQGRLIGCIARGLHTLLLLEQSRIFIAQSLNALDRFLQNTDYRFLLADSIEDAESNRMIENLVTSCSHIGEKRGISLEDVSAPVKLLHAPIVVQRTILYRRFYVARLHGVPCASSPIELGECCVALRRHRLAAVKTAQVGKRKLRGKQLEYTTHQCIKAIRMDPEVLWRWSRGSS